MGTFLMSQCSCLRDGIALFPPGESSSCILMALCFGYYRVFGPNMVFSSREILLFEKLLELSPHRFWLNPHLKPQQKSTKILEHPPTGAFHAGNGWEFHASSPIHSLRSAPVIPIFGPSLHSEALLGSRASGSWRGPGRPRGFLESSGF